jgi:hypothetical protein
MPQTANHDIKALNDRLNRFIVELQQSVSANTSSMSEADTGRALSYLESIDALHDWIVSQPVLDLPETAPRVRDLMPEPEIADVENEEINDLVNLLVIGRDELVNSQSSRHASGLIGFDSERLRSLTTKARAFIEGYVTNIAPLDLPESSPREAMTPAGRAGI